MSGEKFINLSYCILDLIFNATKVVDCQNLVTILMGFSKFFCVIFTREKILAFGKIISNLKNRL